MSFSISFEIPAFYASSQYAKAALDVAMTQAVNVAPVTNQVANGTGAEFVQAVEQAAIVAWAVAQQIALNADTVCVLISGHVNPNYEKSEGWANDFLNVSVSVLRYFSEDSPQGAVDSVDAKVTIPSPTISVGAV